LNTEEKFELKEKRFEESLKKKTKIDPNDDINSDKDMDIRSSRDYWQEIEPKLNKKAKIFDFSGTI